MNLYLHGYFSAQPNSYDFNICELIRDRLKPRALRRQFGYLSRSHCRHP